MKRFFFEDEDDEDDEEMMREAEHAFPEFFPEIFAMSQQEDPNRHILDCAIRICERSFLWRFVGLGRKMNMLRSVFSELGKMVSPVPEPDHDQDQDKDQENK